MQLSFPSTRIPIPNTEKPYEILFHRLGLLLEDLTTVAHFPMIPSFANAR